MSNTKTRTRNVDASSCLREVVGCPFISVVAAGDAVAAQAPPRPPSPDSQDVVPSEETARLAAGGSRFDYHCMSSSVVTFLRGQADRIKRHCVTSIIQIGKALLEAKHHLSHGEFLVWVEAEVGLPVRTAQAYMRVASWASSKGATVAHLAPSVLYVLSASSTPENFTADILSRVEAGEHIAPSILRRELQATRRIRPPGVDGVQKSTPRIQPETSKHLSVAAAGNTSGNAMSELVAILARGLSETDFAQVRDITTNDAVLSDPQFAKSLKYAFLRYGLSTDPR